MEEKREEKIKKSSKQAANNEGRVKNI